MTEALTTEPYWDPYHAELQRSSVRGLAATPREAPAYHNERYGFWALSRFADVLAASLDTETFSSARGITLDSIGDPIPLPMMIMMDPPLHDAFRKVVSRAYTPRRIAGLEDRIRQLCAEYLDPFVGCRLLRFRPGLRDAAPGHGHLHPARLPGRGPRPAPGVERHRPPPGGGEGGPDARGPWRLRASRSPTTAAGPAAAAPAARRPDNGPHRGRSRARRMASSASSTTSRSWA